MMYLRSQSTAHELTHLGSRNQQAPKHLTKRAVHNGKFMSVMKIVETTNRWSASDDPVLSFSLAAPAASAEGWPTRSQDPDRDRSVRT